MISCILTAYKEPRTIGDAIQALLNQTWEDSYELLVVCPDEATTAVVRTFMDAYPQIRHLKDQGVGKPAALNLALAEAQGDIYIFTDGDVEVLSDAVRPLLAPFVDDTCGAVTGRPISISSRTTMFGYWSHLLTDAGAHTLRTRRTKHNQYIDCSGYLYAVRSKLLSPLPKEALADDAYISSLVWMQGYNIFYAPEAHVAVRYPTHYSDWRLQKIRSTAGAAKTAEILASTNPPKRAPKVMRSFLREALEGFWPLLSYPRSFKEVAWTLLLFFARIHLWFSVWTATHLNHHSLLNLWQRVESTK